MTLLPGTAAINHALSLDALHLVPAGGTPYLILQFSVAARAHVTLLRFPPDQQQMPAICEAARRPMKD